MGVINRKQTAVARHLVSREDDGPSITSSSEANINKDKSRNIFQERWPQRKDSPFSMTMTFQHIAKIVLQMLRDMCLNAQWSRHQLWSGGEFAWKSLERPEGWFLQQIHPVCQGLSGSPQKTNTNETKSVIEGRARCAHKSRKSVLSN